MVHRKIRHKRSLSAACAFGRATPSRKWSNSYCVYRMSYCGDKRLKTPRPRSFRYKCAGEIEKFSTQTREYFGFMVCSSLLIEKLATWAQRHRGFRVYGSGKWSFLFSRLLKITAPRLSRKMISSFSLTFTVTNWRFPRTTTQQQ